MTPAQRDLEISGLELRESQEIKMGMFPDKHAMVLNGKSAILSTKDAE